MSLIIKIFFVLGVLATKATCQDWDGEDFSPRLGTVPVLDWNKIYQNLFSSSSIEKAIATTIQNGILSAVLIILSSLFSIGRTGRSFFSPQNRVVREAPEESELENEVLSGKRLAKMLRSFADTAEGFERLENSAFLIKAYGSVAQPFGSLMIAMRFSAEY